MEEHKQKGHCNIYVLDQDSIITGYGKHDRVIAFQPRYAEEVEEIACYVRVDHKWNLGSPTDKQILSVLKHDQGIKGRWKKILSRPWPERNCTELWFCRA